MSNNCTSNVAERGRCRLIGLASAARPGGKSWFCADVVCRALDPKTVLASIEFSPSSSGTGGIKGATSLMCYSKRESLKPTRSAPCRVLSAFAILMRACFTDASRLLTNYFTMLISDSWPAKVSSTPLGVSRGMPIWIESLFAYVLGSASA